MAFSPSRAHNRREPVSPRRTLPCLGGLGLAGLLFFLAFPAHAQEPVAIDVKTAATAKADVAPAEVGTTVCLVQSEWATVREVGEDYSLWLKRYERIKEGQDVRVEMDVELRTPAMIRSGSLIAERPVSAVLPGPGEEPSPSLRKRLDDFEAFRKALTGKLADAADAVRTEAMTLGPCICQAARSMVDEAR